MVKKVSKMITALLLVCAMVFSLTACATKLSGTYTSKGLIEQSFTFKDDNVVVISAFGIDAEGTYVIEDGKIIITYQFMNISYDMEKSFQKDGDIIMIDGTAFVKEG